MAESIAGVGWPPALGSAVRDLPLRSTLNQGPRATVPSMAVAAIGFPSVEECRGLPLDGLALRLLAVIADDVRTQHLPQIRGVVSRDRRHRHRELCDGGPSTALVSFQASARLPLGPQLHERRVRCE